MNFLMTKIVRPIERVFPRYFDIVLGIALLIMIIDKLVMAWLDVPDSEKVCNTAMLVMLSLYCGISRVWLSHPIFNRKYYQFLCLSPWHYGRSLPAGPIHLYWPDLVVWLFLTCLGILFPVNSLWIPVVSFFCGYLICLTITFLLTGQVVCLSLMLFFGIFTIYPFSLPWVPAAFLVSMYGIGLFGIYRFLKEFPWNTSYWTENAVEELMKKAFRYNIIQWPYRFLNDYSQKKISWTASIIISLFTFLFLHLLEIYTKESDLVMAFYVQITLYLLIFRLGRYVLPFFPPISLLGRIFTFRLIIPRYDKVFLPLFVILAVSILGPWVLDLIQVPAPLTFELILPINVFLTLMLPPSIMKWKYTGPYRLLRMRNKPALSPRIPRSAEIIRDSLEKIFLK